MQSRVQSSSRRKLLVAATTGLAPLLTPPVAKAFSLSFGSKKKEESIFAYDTQDNYWKGRASIRVPVDRKGQPVVFKPGDPPRPEDPANKIKLDSYSVNFELGGTVGAGELLLTGPFGVTVADVKWDEKSAVLFMGGLTEKQKKSYTYPSLTSLAKAASKTPLPIHLIPAIFDWLHGDNTEVPGWQADLSKLADGRLGARQVDVPEPPMELGMVLATITDR